MKYKHVNTTGNRVWAYTPPRVQIPNSPPQILEDFLQGFFFFTEKNACALQGVLFLCKT